MIASARRRSLIRSWLRGAISEAEVRSRRARCDLGGPRHAVHVRACAGLLLCWCAVRNSNHHVWRVCAALLPSCLDRDLHAWSLACVGSSVPRARCLVSGGAVALVVSGGAVGPWFTSHGGPRPRRRARPRSIRAAARAYALWRYSCRTQNISEESPLRRHSHQSL